MPQDDPAAVQTDMAKIHAMQTDIGSIRIHISICGRGWMAVTCRPRTPRRSRRAHAARAGRGALGSTMMGFLRCVCI